MIVLDCSAAFDIALATARGRGFMRLMRPQEKVIAPAIYQVEVADAAWKYVHARMKPEAEARLIMETALALPDEIIPIDGLITEAFVQGSRVDHGVYDMLYLVLARRYGATLFTSDKKLQQLCHANNVDCIYELSTSKLTAKE